MIVRVSPTGLQGGHFYKNENLTPHLNYVDILPPHRVLDINIRLSYRENVCQGVRNETIIRN